MILMTDDMDSTEEWNVELWGAFMMYRQGTDENTSWMDIG